MFVVRTCDKTGMKMCKVGRNGGKKNIKSIIQFNCKLQHVDTLLSLLKKFSQEKLSQKRWTRKKTKFKTDFSCNYIAITFGVHVGCFGFWMVFITMEKKTFFFYRLIEVDIYYTICRHYAAAKVASKIIVDMQWLDVVPNEIPFQFWLKIG